MPRSFLVAVAYTALLSACGSDLPSASFIDKLRVLAVQAEPPEIAPGQMTQLSALVLEPDVHQLDGSAPKPTTYVWLACTIPPGTTTQTPCGLGGDSSAPRTAPFCSDAPNAPLCVISMDEKPSYTASTSPLGGKGTAQVLITVVVADTDDGALGCLINTAQQPDNQPDNPDHCVIALKRLTLSDPTRTVEGAATTPPPNHNPALDDFYLTDDKGDNRVSLLDGTGQFTISPDKNAVAMSLRAHRTDASAELEPTYDDAGKVTGSAYEGLTVAWFTTSGTIGGGRSAFAPPMCDTQEMCPTQLPESDVDTSWTPPTAAELAGTALADGTVRLWAVIRDDRGGVSWQAGTLKPR